MLSSLRTGDSRIALIFSRDSRITLIPLSRPRPRSFFIRQLRNSRRETSENLVMETPVWRRQPRLEHYDYSRAGAYFITICTVDRRGTLGKVVDGQAVLDPEGEIVRKTWLALPDSVVGVGVDAFVVMPNHVHGIVTIDADPPAQPAARRRMTLSLIVGRFKVISAKQINLMRGTPGRHVWHRNYYEHIIRTEADMDRVREYIENNPVRWQFDRENPDSDGGDSES